LTPSLQYRAWSPASLKYLITSSATSASAAGTVFSAAATANHLPEIAPSRTRGTKEGEAVAYEPINSVTRFAVCRYDSLMRHRTPSPSFPLVTPNRNDESSNGTPLGLR
jgi:hypothetical protein